jgi:hypothetical protein
VTVRRVNPLRSFPVSNQIGKPLIVRPKQARALLGIGKTLLFQLLSAGVLERVYTSKRAVGISMRSIRALAEGRGKRCRLRGPRPSRHRHPARASLASGTTAAHR